LPEVRLPKPHRSARAARFLLDPEGRFESAWKWTPVDSLKSRTASATPTPRGGREDHRRNDALIVMQGAIQNIGVVAAAFEFEFMGG